MRVADIMRPDVETCFGEDSLAEAARKMWERDIGSLPILDPAGRAVGMITDRDIAMAALLRGRRLDEIRVEETTRGEVWSCHPEDKLDDAEALMADRQVRRVPVVDSEGRLVGILSLNDIANAASDFAEDTGLSAIHVARTLRGVSAPRTRTNAA